MKIGVDVLKAKDRENEHARAVKRLKIRKIK